SGSVLDWLLEENEPSVRYHALTQLLDRDQSDAQVEKTRAGIGKHGWAARILAEQKENTYWDNPFSCTVPKFSACSWQLVFLADLGVSGKDPRIRNCAEHLMLLHNVDEGGFLLDRENRRWNTRTGRFNHTSVSRPRYFALSE